MVKPNFLGSPSVIVKCNAHCTEENEAVVVGTKDLDPPTVGRAPWGVHRGASECCRFHATKK